jgi:hypothetical protein
MRPEGGNPRRPTANELMFLRGLAQRPASAADGRWLPREMLARLPGFEGKNANGLHITAHSLMSKGLVRRRRYKDRIAYQILPAGLAAIGE